MPKPDTNLSGFFIDLMNLRCWYPESLNFVQPQYFSFVSAIC
jgi:hypothetical protein